MRIFISTLFAAFIFLSFISCEKDDELNEILGDVNIYLLDSYKSSGYGTISKNSIVLKPEPLISYSEIISYNKDEYVFEISENAMQITKGEQIPAHGLPFAVTANKEIIYTGYFWSRISSAICEAIIIELIVSEFDNSFNLSLKLGFPEDLVSVPDKRNDNRILNIFRRDNKLIQ